MANRNAHFRCLQLSSIVCVTAVALTLGAQPALARLDIEAEYGAVEAAAARRAATADAAQLRTGLSSLHRTLPAEPDPVLLYVPAEATASQLRGEYVFKIALGLFAGAVLVGTLLTLFLGLSGWLWAEDDAPSPPSQPQPR